MGLRANLFFEEGRIDLGLCLLVCNIILFFSFMAGIGSHGTDNIRQSTRTPPAEMTGDGDSGKTREESGRALDELGGNWIVWGTALI
jgi:hypothetical protein